MSKKAPSDHTTPYSKSFSRILILLVILVCLVSRPAKMNGSMVTSLENLKDNFDKIVLTFGSCGVELPSKEILKDICYFINNDSEDFKRLALLVHCCVSSHFGQPLSQNCRSLAKGGEVSLVEGEISLQNLDEFHQHSTCLLGFCMYFNSVEQTELIRIYQKNIEEVQKVLESQTSEIASIAAKLFERSAKALRKTELHKRKMVNKAKSMKRVSSRSKAVLGSLMSMRLSLKTQQIHKDWRRFAPLDWLLGAEGLLFIWSTFMLTSYMFCNPQFQRYKAKFSAVLLICTIVSVVIDRLSILCSGSISSVVDPFKLRLLLKGLNMVLLLHALKKTLAGQTELDRISKLMQLKKSCDDFSRMPGFAYMNSCLHSSIGR